MTGSHSDSEFIMTRIFQNWSLKCRRLKWNLSVSHKERQDPNKSFFPRQKIWTIWFDLSLWLKRFFPTNTILFHIWLPHLCQIWAAYKAELYTIFKLPVSKWYVLSSNLTQFSSVSCLAKLRTNYNSQLRYFWISKLWLHFWPQYVSKSLLL